MTRLADQQRYQIVNSLLSYIEGPDEEQRDLSSLGLKKVVQQLPNQSKSATVLVAKVSNRLVEKVIPRKGASQGLLTDSLDITTEIFERFTPAVQGSKTLQLTSLDAFFGVLSHTNAGVRKRAITALSALGPSAASDVFSELCSRILIQLQRGTSVARRTMVQLISALAKSAPRRIGRRLPEFVPVILPLAELDGEDTDAELVESCLLTFEQLLTSCASEVTRYVDRFVLVALNGLTFDPNYAGDTGNSDDEDDYMDENFADSDDELDLEDYGDDDDNSWQVRRASALALEAAIKEAAANRHIEQLVHLADKLTPALVARISEREETVRIDVIRTLIALIQAAQQRQSDALNVGPLSSGADALKRKFGDMDMSNDLTPRGRIAALAPSICKTVDKELSAKSVETRTYCLSLLRHLIALLDGGLDEYVATFLNKVNQVLKDTASTSSDGASLKVDLLVLLTLIFDHHPASTFEGQLGKVLPFLVSSIGDNLHKVSSAGLHTTASLVASLKPLSRGSNLAASPADDDAGHHGLVRSLYSAVIGRLERSDADQAIRTDALHTLGVILAHAGTVIEDQFPTLLPMLLDRLHNETTREATIKVIVAMRGSDEIRGGEVDSFFQSCVTELASLLHHARIEIKSEALIGLVAIIPRVPSLSEDTASLILSYLSFDAHLLVSSLKVTLAVLSAQPAAQPIFLSSVWPKLRETLLGQTLLAPTVASLLDFFSSLATIAPPLLPTILDDLFTDANSADAKLAVGPDVSGDGTAQTRTVSALQARTVIAKAIGASLRYNVPADTVNRAVATAQAACKASEEWSTIFGLITVGEIGRWKDLVSDTTLLSKLVAFFDSESEDVRRTAGVALGALALGNMDAVLPVIRTNLEGSSREQSLALSALKELIVGVTIQVPALTGAREVRARGVSPVAATAVALPDSIFAMLASAAKGSDEANSVLGAECLGRLTLTDMMRYLPQLVALAKQSDSKSKEVALIGLRITLTEPRGSYDTLLASSVPTFLHHLSDPDHEVRREAVLAFTSVAYNKPHLLRDTVADLMPLVYEQTLPRAELQRSIPMGAFTMVIDDGFDLRKGAFDALITLLDSFLYTKINLPSYTDAVVAGLKDADASIRSLCGMIIVRLTVLAPSVVATKTNVIADYLVATLETKTGLKKEATQQDIERASEAQNAVFRTTAALVRVAAAGLITSDAPRFTELLRECHSDKNRRAYEEVERTAAVTGFTARTSG